MQRNRMATKPRNLYSGFLCLLSMAGSDSCGKSENGHSTRHAAKCNGARFCGGLPVCTLRRTLEDPNAALTHLLAYIHIRARASLESTLAHIGMAWRHAHLNATVPHLRRVSSGRRENAWQAHQAVCVLFFRHSELAAHITPATLARARWVAGKDALQGRPTFPPVTRSPQHNRVGPDRGPNRRHLGTSATRGDARRHTLTDLTGSSTCSILMMGTGPKGRRVRSGRMSSVASGS